MAQELSHGLAPIREDSPELLSDHGEGQLAQGPEGEPIPHLIGHEGATIHLLCRADLARLSGGNAERRGLRGSTPRSARASKVGEDRWGQALGGGGAWVRRTP